MQSRRFGSHRCTRERWSPVKGDSPWRTVKGQRPGEFPDRTGGIPPVGSPGVPDPSETLLEGVYDRRFGNPDSARKDGVWAEIVRYLQRFVPPDAKVLDIGCDRGYFVRHVLAAERWGSDVRDVRKYLPPDIRFVQAAGLELGRLLAPQAFDIVFMSNYLEHLLSRAEVVRQLEVTADLLRPGGRVLVLQPNVRHVGGAYWDFIDHHVALTERSLREAAEMAGFRTERVISKFLPYSTLGKLPQRRFLVKAYLRFPLAWSVLGKQTLYVGTRSSSGR